MTAPTKKRVVLLGATGSIGENALRVIAAHRDKLELVGIAARSNWEKLAATATAFGVQHVGVFDDAAFAARPRKFRGVSCRHTSRRRTRRLGRTRSTPPKPTSCSSPSSAPPGLEPALAALAAGKDLALAVEGDSRARRQICDGGSQKARRVKLLPVDSEHNAVFQCLEGHPHAEVCAASCSRRAAAAFRDWSADRLAHVTPAEALKHPNWSMGPKITVDSATLANKGLELIEAPVPVRDFAPEQCTAVLHPQSIVHCLVEFTDGRDACPAFAAVDDVSHPARPAPPPHGLRASMRPLILQNCWGSNSARWMKRASRCCASPSRPMAAGGVAPAIYNAANEVAVTAFLNCNIPFLAIPRDWLSTL